jgi:hypothetical protein
MKETRGNRGRQHYREPRAMTKVKQFEQRQDAATEGFRRNLEICLQVHAESSEELVQK